MMDVLQPLSSSWFQSLSLLCTTPCMWTFPLSFFFGGEASSKSFKVFVCLKKLGGEWFQSHFSQYLVSIRIFSCYWLFAYLHFPLSKMTVPFIYFLSIFKIFNLKNFYILWITNINCKDFLTICHLYFEVVYEMVRFMEALHFSIL